MNSKNEYNANHMSRVVVDEDAFEKKRKAREEEKKKIEEKKAWEKFRLEHTARPKRTWREDENRPAG